MLRNIPPGGPYLLKLECGTASVTVRSFFVGDVWVLGGQSNMQGMGNMTGAAKSRPLMRAFSMRREWRKAEDPPHVLEESPDACHHADYPMTRTEAERHRRETVKGVGIFFGREMLSRSHVPRD